MKIDPKGPPIIKLLNNRPRFVHNPPGAIMPKVVSGYSIRYPTGYWAVPAFIWVVKV